MSPVFLETEAATGSNIAVVTFQLKPERVTINAITQGSCAMPMPKIPGIPNALLIPHHPVKAEADIVMLSAFSR